jgi:hypothetical protein
MRTILWTTILATALSTSACNKKQDDTGAAASEVKKTQENANDTQKDLDKTLTDKKATDKDLNKAEANNAMANTDAQAAKDKYGITVNDRLAKLDIKLKELQAKMDQKSKDAAVVIANRRAELATKTALIKDHAAADWDAFTKDVDNTFDGIEKDLNADLK